MSTKYKETKDVPNKAIIERLEELSNAITKGKRAFDYEFTMRVPAELDRDADIVLMLAARRLKAFNDFYDSVSYLFAEGVEFMNKTELYDAFKKEYQKLSLR